MDSWLFWFFPSSVTSLQGGHGVQIGHVANSFSRFLVCHADRTHFHKQPISQYSSKIPTRLHSFPAVDNPNFSLWGAGSPKFWGKC